MGFDFRRDCRSAQVGWELCRILRYLERGSAAECAVALRGYEAYIPRGSYVGCIEETAIAPRVASIRYVEENIELWLLRGVYRRDTARNLFTSYLSPNPTPRAVEGNNWINAAARSVFANVGGRDLLTDRLPSEIWLCGHSYGGLLSQAVAFMCMFRDELRNVPVRIVTFGSPRIADATWCDRFNESRVHARWFNDNDPVRHMPPHADEGAVMHAAATRAISDRLNSYLHTSTGLCLRDSGVIERRADTPEIRPISEVNLLTWAVGVMDTTQRDHALITYETRLGLAAALEQAPVAPRPNAPIRPDVVIVPPAQNAPVVQQAAAVFVAAVREREARPAPASRASLFRAAKRNGIWVVIWQGNTVCVAGRKSHARSIARRGNLIIRTLEPDDIEGWNLAMQSVARMA